VTVYNAWDVADTIFVEVSNRKRMIRLPHGRVFIFLQHIYNRAPAWADEKVRQNLSDVNDLAFQFLFANNDSRRIRGGKRALVIEMGVFHRMSLLCQIRPISTRRLDEHQCFHSRKIKS
jgi:hypothetical protein